MSILITDVKVILTAPEGINLLVVKVETNQPGLYGLGCGTFAYRHLAVKCLIEEYIRPLVLGRDVHAIEEIWQLMHQNAYWRNAHDAAIARTLSVSTMSSLCCPLVTCLAQYATSVDANVYCIFVPCTEKLPNRVNIEAATRDEGLCQGHSHLCVIRKFAWFPVERATAHHLTHATKNWFRKPTKPLTTRTKLKWSACGVSDCGTNY